MSFIARKFLRMVILRLRYLRDVLGFSSYAHGRRGSIYPREPDALGEHLANRASFRFFWSPEVRDEIVDLGLASSDLAGELDALAKVAHDAAEHRFDILGSGPTYLGRSIDWSRDFKSGESWPVRHHSRVGFLDLLDLERSSDIKVPWELSRLQFLPQMALAALYARDETLVRSLKDLLDDWDTKNPVGWGLAWSSPMDAALRAVSLIWTVHFTVGTPWNDVVISRRVLEMLIEHGRFIHKNLEFSDVNMNHHTACLLGLLYLGLFLNEVPETRDWRRQAVSGLRREIEAQTYPDGVCHEGSIPYHRLVTEMFLHAQLLCDANQVDLGDSYRSRLAKMLEFVMAYTNPSGRAALFGDGDDGRVVRLGAQHINDHRYLLTIGGAMLGSVEMSEASGSHWLDAVWLVGQDALRDIGHRPETRQVSTGFEQGGYFFLRGQEDWIAIDCGDVGWRGRGGHGHNDTLSVEVCLRGRELLTDSGCFVYSSSKKERYNYLSVAAHNACMVDREEPAPINTEGFQHVSHLPSRQLRWSPGDKESAFDGEHSGYERLPVPVTYRRSVVLTHEESRATIRDQLLGDGRHEVRWNFHFAPGWEVVEESEGTFTISGAGEQLFQFAVNDSLLSSSLSTSNYFPSYGVRIARPCVVARGTVELPFEVLFEMTPYTSGMPR